MPALPFPSGLAFGKAALKAQCPHPLRRVKSQGLDETTDGKHLTHTSLSENASIITSTSTTTATSFSSLHTGLSGHLGQDGTHLLTVAMVPPALNKALHA